MSSSNEQALRGLRLLWCENAASTAVQRIEVAKSL